MTQGSLGDGGVLRRHGEPEVRDLFSSVYVSLSPPPSRVDPYRVGVPVVGRTVFRLPIDRGEEGSGGEGERKRRGKKV